jgi:hypothetical protein
MSNLVKNLYPLCCCKISHMIGVGYYFLLTALFNSHKSLTQWTLPSFLGVINVGETHSLAPCGDKMPIFTKCNNSFLMALRCITGTRYGLECLGMAPGTKSIWNFLWG